MTRINKTTVFVGRQRELQLIRSLEQKSSSSLVVIKGRRRAGKSRLIEEYAAGKKSFYFTGLPRTTKVSAQEQRSEFCRQLQKQFNLPGIFFDDWEVKNCLGSIFQ